MNKRLTILNLFILNTTAIEDTYNYPVGYLKSCAIAHTIFGSLFHFASCFRCIIKFSVIIIIIICFSYHA